MEEPGSPRPKLSDIIMRFLRALGGLPTLTAKEFREAPEEPSRTDDIDKDW